MLSAVMMAVAEKDPDGALDIVVMLVMIVAVMLMTPDGGRDDATNLRRKRRFLVRETPERTGSE